jgi:arsenite methyltransferase
VAQQPRWWEIVGWDSSNAGVSSQTQTSVNVDGFGGLHDWLPGKGHTHERTVHRPARDRPRSLAAAATAVAEGGGGCCGPQAIDVDDTFGSTRYAASDRDEPPAEVVAASLGCGNPVAVAELREGERVLDLGSGGGIDVLLSARRVGPTGKAYGLDMTEEMLALALANTAKAGATNVEFRKGTIEAIPLPAHTIDVVISN